jgi:hypothetical protein
MLNDDPQPVPDPKIGCWSHGWSHIADNHPGQDGLVGRVISLEVAPDLLSPDMPGLAILGTIRVQVPLRARRFSGVLPVRRLVATDRKDTEAQSAAGTFGTRTNSQEPTMARMSGRGDLGNGDP